jgi:hypothetical protein
MSDTYDLACHDCKASLWIGQSGSSPWCFYTGEPETMQALGLFFWAHRGHRLEFNECQLLEYVADLGSA